MSEPTREEILAVLEAWKKEFSKMQTWYEIDEEIFQAIYRLIENRPRVTREFVEKWADNLNPDKLIGLHKEQAISHLWWREQQLETMLRELRHEIEGDKEA